MILWLANIETIKPLSSLPRTICVSGERRDSPSYHHWGRYRQNEKHCLFKYTLRGAGRFRDAHGEYRIGLGQGFLCDICDPATSYYYPEGGAEAWEFVYICLEGPTVTAMVREMTERFGPVYTLPIEGDFIAQLLDWRRFDGQRRYLSPAESAACAMQLLTTLAGSKEEEQRGNGHYLALRAQKLIRERLTQSITASQLADLLGISREHLTRTFREQLGQTPYQYIIRQQLLLACRLLKETGLSVKEISERTGCESQEVFTRRFKQHFHITPTTFRKVGTVPVR